MVDTVERDLLMPVMAMVVTVEDTEVTEVPMEVSEEVMEVTMVDTEDMDGECIFVFSITLNTPHRGLVIICHEIQIPEVTKFYRNDYLKRKFIKRQSLKLISQLVDNIKDISLKF